MERAQVKRLRSARDAGSLAASPGARLRRERPQSWRQRALKVLDGAVDARPASVPRLRPRSTWAWWELAAPVLISALAVFRLVWAAAQ